MVKETQERLAYILAIAHLGESVCVVAHGQALAVDFTRGVGHLRHNRPFHPVLRRQAGFAGWGSLGGIIFRCLRFFNRRGLGCVQIWLALYILGQWCSKRCGGFRHSASGEYQDQDYCRKEFGFHIWLFYQPA